MTAKTPKKTTKKNDPWADVEAVKATVTPEKVGDSPEEGSPFGSMTPIMKLIDGFRKQVSENPIPMNGRATAPDGTVYAYYMTEDVLASVHKYCENNKGFLDIGVAIDEQGNNVMEMTLVDMPSSDFKHVQANLGKPQSSSDFGSRITYVPKYLVAIMFGISIQTDSDAFNNGKKINNESRQHEPVADTTNDSSSSSGDTTSPKVTTPNTGSPVPTSNNSGSSGVDSSVSPQGEQRTLEHSQSYPVAKGYIERSLSNEMLDTAEQKIATAKQLHDFERVELKELITEKRKSLK